MQKIIFLSFALYTISNLAYSWGELGHKAVAEIAERNLTPEAKQMVLEILGGVPLSVASVFPDQVRDDKRFKSFDPYHYFEIGPNNTPNTAAKAQPANPSADTYLSEAPDRIARVDLPAITPSLNQDAIDKILVIRDEILKEKEEMLFYLIHLVGDVHQPLHVGNGIDMGANLCDVKFIDPETGTIVENNLHMVWDEQIFDYEKHDFKKQNLVVGAKKKYFGYPVIVEKALESFKKTDPTAGTDLESAKKVLPLKWATDAQLHWYDEAQKLHATIYPDGDTTKPAARPYCKQLDPKTHAKKEGNYDKGKIPTLDEAYVRRALPIAYRQIVLGGFRLAAMLNEMAKVYKPINRVASPKAFEKLLEAAQLK